MSASLTDKFTRTRNGARPNSGRVTLARTTGGTTLTVDNLSGWPTASKVHCVTYKIDTNDDPIEGTQVDWVGIVTSSTSIGSLTLQDGTDNGNAIGDVVEMLPTAAWGEDLAEGLEAEHNRNGTHGAITTTSITNAGNISQTNGSSINDDSSNELIKFSKTASAVNEVTVTNAATGNAPQLSATGGDTNIDLRLAPKGTGSVKKGASGGSIDWWEELGRASLSVAGDTITVSSITAKKYLRIMISTSVTGGNQIAGVRFNNDSSGNYGQRTSGNGAADTTASAQSSIFVGTASRSLWIVYDVVNIATTEKQVMGMAHFQSSGSAAPDRIEMYGQWSNTSNQITRVDIVNAGTGDFNVGSEVIILGHD